METIATFTPDNLSADIGFPEVRETREIPAGTAVKRGDILGADFKPIVTGGSVDSIALEPIAADATMRVCVVAVTGAFNANALSTGDATKPIEWNQNKLTIFVRQPAP
jgi:hypothetical protein